MSDVMENLTAMIEYAEATKRFADAGSLKLVATEIETLRAKVAELEAGSEQQAKAAKVTRPECFEFAMDYLGDPEASLVRAYIEDLEAAVEQPVNVESIARLIELELMNNSSSDAGVICDAAAKRIAAMLSAQNN